MAKKGRQRAPVARALSVAAVVEDDAPVPVAEEAVLVADKAADNTVLVFDSAKLGLKFIKKTMPLTITGLTPGGVAAKRFGVELSEGMQVVAIASASTTPARPHASTTIAAGRSGQSLRASAKYRCVFVTRGQARRACRKDGS